MALNFSCSWHSSSAAEGREWEHENVAGSENEFHETREKFQKKSTKSASLIRGCLPRHPKVCEDTL